MEPIIFAPSGLSIQDELFLKDNDSIIFYYSNNSDTTISIELNKETGIYSVEKNKTNEEPIQFQLETDLKELLEVFNRLNIKF